MTDFRINVVVDPSRVPAGTRSVERELTRVENRANRVQRSFVRMLAPLAGGAAIFGAVRSIAQFEESLATARAVTDATGEQFEQLRDRALELGATTRFSAREAADGLVLLARAGFTVDESLESVDDTLRLAQAASIGLAEAADITANVLRGFRLEVSQTERVTDALVAVSNNANTTVSELGQGLKFVAPIAATLGRSVEETSAALGVLADAGLKATLGGTGLRRVLGELASPSDQLRQLLEGAGVALEDVNPKTNDLADVIAALAETSISAGEALEIFGQRGAPAVLNLVANVDRLQRLNGQLANNEGVTRRVAETLDNTLNGALFRARSALDALVQSFGQEGGSQAFVNALDGIAAALRFVAENMDVVLNITTALTALIATRLVASLVSGAIPALRALAFSLTLSGGAANVAAAALARLNVAALANPWFIAAAAIAAATVALQKYISELNAAGRILDQVVQDQLDSFNSLGAGIANAQREINRLNRIIEEGGDKSGTLAARVAVLQERIKGYAAESKTAADRQKELQEAQAATETTVENTLSKLARQAELLRSLNREKQIEAQAEREIAQLRQAGVVVTPEQVEAIRLAVQRNDQLKLQRQLLEDIRGPQEAFNQNSAALQQLLDRGAISADEFQTKLQELKDSLSDGSGDGFSLGPDQNSLDRLRESVELQSLATNQSRFVADAVALENQLRREGVKITSEVQAQIGELLLKQKQLTEEERNRAELVRNAAREADREARLLSQLERRIAGTAAVADEQRRLNQLFQEGRITAEQYAVAQDQIALRGLQAARTLEAGFQRAFIKLKQEAEDLAAVGERVIDVFANQATDALVEFATTGQFSFKEFATAILTDLIRIIARLLIVQALQAAIGGLGGGAGGAAVNAAAGAGQQALAGARENGGTMQPNRSYLVGENGPEIVTPGRTSAVTPNAASQPQQPTPVNVQVVNVQSEDDIPQAINDGAADEAIVNALQRNRDKVQQVVR